MSEELLTVAQVCSKYPGARNAKTVSPSTVTRWIITGCPSRVKKEWIKLRATRVGSRWMTTQTALEEFFKALNEEG